MLKDSSWKSRGMPQRHVTSSVWFSHCITSIYHYRVMIHTDNYTYMGSVSASNYPVGRRSMTVVRKERRWNFILKWGNLKHWCVHMQCACLNRALSILQYSHLYSLIPMWGFKSAKATSLLRYLTLLAHFLALLFKYVNTFILDFWNVYYQATSWY